MVNSCCATFCLVISSCSENLYCNYYYRADGATSTFATSGRLDQRQWEPRVVYHGGRERIPGQEGNRPHQGGGRADDPVGDGEKRGRYQCGRSGFGAAAEPVYRGENRNKATT
ncbi:unnamed protein product [Amoebophrya sp. A120]|nr:unnamed protein product [Amoebophrya sp. A120]|eukprot:GSA120T00007152001.1